MPVAALLGHVGSPLGRALALELGTRGYSLALADADPHSLEDIVDEAFATSEASPFKVSAHGVDVHDLASVRLCAEEIEADHSRVDLCVVLATRDAALLPVAEIGQAKFARLLGKHVQSFFHIVRVFLPLLAKAPLLPVPVVRPANVPSDFKLVTPPPLAGVASPTQGPPKPSAFILVLTPDYLHPRPHRGLTCAIQRAWASAVENLNTQSDGRYVVGLTAVVGSLAGEDPWWTQSPFSKDPSEELPVDDNDDDDDDTDGEEGARLFRAPTPAIEEGDALQAQRHSVAEDTMVSVTPRVFARRHSRTRHQVLPMLLSPDLPGKPIVATAFASRECLLPSEAALWLISSLSYGKALLLIGWDVRLVNALPLAFKCRLFEQRPLPSQALKPRLSNLAPTNLRAQERVLADKRSNVRKVLRLIPAALLLFGALPFALALVSWLLLALVLLDLVSAWMIRTFVTTVLRITPWRRLSFLQMLRNEYLRLETKLFVVMDSHHQVEKEKLQ